MRTEAAWKELTGTSLHFPPESIENFFLRANHRDGRIMQGNLNQWPERTDNTAFGEPSLSRRPVVPPGSFVKSEGLTIVRASEQRSTFCVKL
jgi:hypothetical protein